MIKNILLSITLFIIPLQINANDYFNANELKETQAFAEGFQLAITGTKLKEFKLQGYKNESIKFDEYIVVVDSTGLDDAKKFLIQSFGFKYFDAVRLSNEWIVLGSFKQKPNAELLMESLNNKWFKVLDKSRRAFIHQNAKDEVYTKAKSFHSDIAELIEEDINKNKQILLVEKITAVQPIEVTENTKKEMKVENIPTNQNLSRKIPLSKQIVKKEEKNDKKNVKKESKPVIKKFEELNIPKNEPKEIKQESPNEKIMNLVNPTIYELILKESAALIYKNTSNKYENVPSSSIIEAGNYENTGIVYISDKKITDEKGKVYFKILNKEVLLRSDDVIIAKESRL